MVTRNNPEVKPHVVLGGTVTTINTGDWLNILHKVDTESDYYAHFWRQNKRAGESAWFGVHDNAARRKAFLELAGGDMYVSVNPSYQIPPCNKSGNTNPRYIAKQSDYIGAVNVLITEYDGKDFVRPAEYAQYLPADFDQLTGHHRRTAVKVAKEIAFYFDPDVYKQRAFDAVRACRFAPTIIIDSGGGYHCYWVLSSTLYIDDNNRIDIIDTQHGWVRMNGGDTGRCDISSFLRVPGTKNCKDGWAGRNPTVTIIEYNPEWIYEYADLEAAVMDWQMEQRSAGTDVHDTVSDADKDCPELGTVRATFNARYSCIKLLEKRGYKIVHQNKDKAGNVALTRMSRPGKDGVASVTIFPATDKLPEIAVMWSGNDDLHSELVTSADGKSKREGRDAYKVFAALYCNNDSKAAWVAAKKALGMWR